MGANVQSAANTVTTAGVAARQRAGCKAGMMGISAGNTASEDPPRLDVPPMTDWKIFPFEGDFRVREILPATETERVRAGEPGGPPCGCENDEPDPLHVWTGGRWQVRRILFGEKQAPFPSYMLQTVEHLDFEDFDDELAAEFGLMTIRMRDAVSAIGGIGRVHVNRWGDGGSHFHVWFLGRPKGAWQFSGYTLPLWGFILPPLDETTLAHNDTIVSAELTARALP